MPDYADWTKNLIADIRANGRPTSGYFERAHLVANPVVTVETDGQTFQASATAAEGADRDSAPSCPQACGRRAAMPIRSIGPCARDRAGGVIRSDSRPP